MNAIEILKESGFVQRDWYIRKYPDVGLLGMHPAEHYYKIGAQLGRNPGVKFDTEFYLERYPDVAESGMKSGANVRRMEAAGADAVLVGEALMRAGSSAGSLTSEITGQAT